MTKNICAQMCGKSTMASRCPLSIQLYQRLHFMFSLQVRPAPKPNC